MFSVNIIICVLIDHPFTISQSPQIYHTTAILLLLREMEFGVSETRVMKNGCLVNANNMLGMSILDQFSVFTKQVYLFSLCGILLIER